MTQDSTTKAKKTNLKIRYINIGSMILGLILMTISLMLLNPIFLSKTEIWLTNSSEMFLILTAPSNLLWIAISLNLITFYFSVQAKRIDQIITTIGLVTSAIGFVITWFFISIQHFLDVQTWAISQIVFNSMIYCYWIVAGILIVSLILYGVAKIKKESKENKE